MNDEECADCGEEFGYCTCHCDECGQHIEECDCEE